MKLVTKQTDYAIRALLALAQHKGAFLASRAIAQSQKIPLQFLRGTLQTLVQHGVVRAKEGATGGFALAHTPERIHVSGIIGMFQGPVSFTECMFRKKMCTNRATCPLRHRLVGIERMVAREFERITIAALLKDLESHA